MGQWFTDLPTTWAALVAMTGSAALSVAGLLAVHPVVPHGLRRAHNDVSGFTLATVGVIYAVLLAFIAVAVWQGFGQADALVQTEANLAGDLYRDSVALPDPLAAKLRHTLYVYAETVVQDEWPALAEGRVEEDAGWQLLDVFHVDLAELNASDSSTAFTQAEMLHLLNGLYDARRGRFHAATATIPAALWWNLLAGAAILMLFSYLFGVPRLLMHAAMVALLGASIGLVLMLIFLLKDPFMGDNHVSVEPFNRLVRAVETMSYPHN
ncbi:MAG TPA: hypothetical protein VKI44_08905 [Acetobacteraceae bacterium]|nr:hypothetical protein [Acetobacteraceae bacterium]